MLRARRLVATVMAVTVCLLAVPGSSPAAYAAGGPSCADMASVGSIVGCGTVTSQYALPDAAGQPWYAIKRNGSYFIKIASKTGGEIVVESATSDLNGIYKSEATAVYHSAAIRQNAVRFFTDSYAPKRPTIPSSAAAAAVGESATVREAEAAVASQSNLFKAGRVLTTTGKWAGRAFVVGSVVEAGWSLGHTMDGWACSAGASWFCVAERDPAYVVNADVAGAGADPGWVGGFNQLTDRYGNTFTFGLSPGYGFTAGDPVPDPPPPVLSVSPYDKDRVTYFRGGTAVTYAANGTSCGSVGGDLWVMPSGHLDVVGCGEAGSPGAVVVCDSAASVCGMQAAAGVHVVQYLLSGNPARPAPVGDDPVRHLLTSSYCSDETVRTARSGDFHESDAKWPTMPVTAECPAGSHLQRMTVVEQSAGLADKTLVDYKVPQAMQDFYGAYPQCQGDALCTLTLRKNVSGSWQDCFDHLGAGLCDGWFADPNKATDYQCAYGPSGNRQPVALSECNSLSPTFDLDKQGRRPPYGDPRDGSSQDDKAPSTPSDPNPGCQTDPTATGCSADDPVTKDPTSGAPGDFPDSDNCWTSGWSFNPFSWVLVPVKCALTWAFVPDTGVVAGKLSDTWDMLKARPPLSLVVAFVGPVQTFMGTVVGGCTDPLFNLSHGVAIPCEPGFAFYSVIRFAMTGGLLFFFGWRVFRLVESGMHRGGGEG